MLAVQTGDYSIYRHILVRTDFSSSNLPVSHDSIQHIAFGAYLPKKCLAYT